MRHHRLAHYQEPTTYTAKSPALAAIGSVVQAVAGIILLGGAVGLAVAAGKAVFDVLTGAISPLK